VEAELGDTARCEYPNRDAGPMGTALGATASMLVNWTSALQVEPANIHETVVTAFKVQINQVSAMRELLEIREHNIVEMTKLEKKVETHVEARAQGKKPSSMSSMFGGPKLSLDELIEQMEKELRDSRRLVGVLGRALFYSEIDRYNNERRTTHGAAMGAMAASAAMTARKVASLIDADTPAFLQAQSSPYGGSMAVPAASAPAAAAPAAPADAAPAAPPAAAAAVERVPGGDAGGEDLGSI
jgi:hypothetical protein